MPSPVFGRVVMLPWCRPGWVCRTAPPTRCDGPVTVSGKIQHGSVSSPGASSVAGIWIWKPPTVFAGGWCVGGTPTGGSPIGGGGTPQAVRASATTIHEERDIILDATT